jgi:hypothetical protein
MKSNARCPACGGAIHAIASRCKHCKAPLAAANAPASVAAPPPPAPTVAAVVTTAPASWSGRWPLVVAAVALLAIGVSLGVLLEQWRQSSTATPRESPRATTPRMVPDRMPAPELPARPGVRSQTAP